MMLLTKRIINLKKFMMHVNHMSMLVEDIKKTYYKNK